MGRDSLFNISNEDVGMQLTPAKNTEPLTSRRATLIPWRGQLLVKAKDHLGEKLPFDWEKKATEDGTPFYVNHQSHQTQWLDPRLEACLEELKCHDDIRLAVYRTASKMRDFQVYTRMSKVHISDILDALFSLNLSGGTNMPPAEYLKADEIATVLLEIFSKLKHPLAHVEVMVSWLLEVYDRDRTGQISTISLKIALSTLCVSWIEEKYRYVFGLLDTNADGMITREQLAQYINFTVQMLVPIREAWPFGPTAQHIEDAVNQCCQLERKLSGVPDTLLISLETFLDWCMMEPRPLIWIPTLHRIAATENVCAVCKMYPIIGFRYRSITCIDKDICQECYWTGREGNGHKNSHEVREYCFPTTMKEDMLDLKKKVKSKFIRLFRRKKRTTENTATGFPPLEPVKSNADDVRISANNRDSTATTVRVEDEGVSGNLQRDGDDDSIIGRMAARLNQGDSGAEPSTMVVTLETEQKLHLLRVIDELDAENRDLLQRVMQLQEKQQDKSMPSSTPQHDLENRIQVLSERNRELLNQLNRLQSYQSSIRTESHISEIPLETSVELEEIEQYLNQEDVSDDLPYLSIDTDDVESVPQHRRDGSSSISGSKIQNTQFKELIEYTKELNAGLQFAVKDMGAAVSQKDSTQMPKPQSSDESTGKINLADDTESLIDTYVPQENVIRHSHGVQKERAQLTAHLQYTEDKTSKIPKANVKEEGVSLILAQEEGEVVEAVPAPPPATSSNRQQGGKTGAVRVFDAKTAGQQSVTNQSPKKTHITASSQRVVGSPVVRQHSTVKSATQSPRDARLSLKPTTPNQKLRDGQDIRDRELRETVRRVHDNPYQLPRQLSFERRKQGEVLFDARLRRVKERFESAVGIPFGDVKEENLRYRLLRHFADGHLLCVLANIKLRARQLPTIKPNCAHHRLPLTPTKIIANFNNLVQSCKQLGMIKDDIPTSYDFQSLHSELEHPVPDRVKHNKILSALETLLSMSGGQGPEINV